MNVSATKELWKRDENAYYYKDPKKALRNWLEVFTNLAHHHKKKFYI
jgi:hypothetical protein